MNRSVAIWIVLDCRRGGSTEHASNHLVTFALFLVHKTLHTCRCRFCSWWQTGSQAATWSSHHASLQPEHAHFLSTAPRWHWKRKYMQFRILEKDRASLAIDSHASYFFFYLSKALYIDACTHKHINNKKHSENADTSTSLTFVLELWPWS